MTSSSSHAWRWPATPAALLLAQSVACTSNSERAIDDHSASGSGAGGTAAAANPGRKDMHRLNTAEYNATVEDVLGTKLQPATGNWRGGELGGFDNMASVLGMDEAQYVRYFDAAKTLAAELFASHELGARFVSCEPSAPDCARASLETAGLRFFRRPLAPEELATYQRVYESALALGDPPLAALELSFQALLSSAEFLYRIEFDADPASNSARPLSSFELASRLSYFLWSSTPDDRLLQAAADDSLQLPSGIVAAAERMLADPKSQRFVTSFAGQWLGARRVLSHAVAPELYYWNPRVARAAGDEMVRFFSEFVSNDRSWFEFVLADVNYVDQWLAPLYDMPSPISGTERVEYRGDQRAGFFGLAGFLALSSFDRRTSPSLRGRFIASNLLCAAPPDPPPNVPELEPGEQEASLNVRQTLERHRQSPDCAYCHALFDPYGLALEEYDAVGRYRSAYADGTPVDATASLPASETYPEGMPFTGLDGLARVVAGDPRFGECLAEKLLTYALGRPVTESDQPYLQQVQREWRAPGQVPSVRRLIHTLVSSEPFRYRRGQAPASPQP